MRSIENLLEIMAKLRDPHTGCPWDQQQDFSSIAPYTVEEAYEVADAIAREDLDGLREELGDLLFQVAFHARMAEEQGAFDFDAVATGICDKMIRRHPHVFGTAREREKGPQKGSWQKIKAAERADKEVHSSALDGVARALPALKRAEKLGKGLPQSASTGRTRADPETRLTRNSASWRWPARQATRRTCSRNSVTCCSRSSTWRGTSGSIPSRHCPGLTENSNGDFARWNRKSSQPGRLSRTWTSRPSNRTGNLRKAGVHKPFSFGEKQGFCVQPRFIAFWLCFVPGSERFPGHVPGRSKEHETETLDDDNVESRHRVAGPGC